MENIPEKIANLQVQISENCTEKEKNIIQLYWQLQGLEFVNTVKWIKAEFEISQADLNKLIASDSTLSLFVYCANCDSYENHWVKTKTQFLEVLKVNSRRFTRSFFKCEYCTQKVQEKLDLLRADAKRKLIEKVEQAIDSKNWNNLNRFEREILSNCLEMKFTQLGNKYGDQLGQGSYIKMIRALEKIAQENLIHIIRDKWKNYILDYQTLPRLSEFKDEIKAPKIITPSYVKIDRESDELKFKLTINDRQYHPDSPKYAGTITFKERIVIEPGVEYIFGVWPRANENLYLTMTPLENLEKLPIQKRINSQPISLQEGITDFLNRLGKNI